MIVAWTTLPPADEAKLVALPPDDRARYDEIVGFLQFEQRQMRFHAERDAFKFVMGFAAESGPRPPGLMGVR